MRRVLPILLVICVLFLAACGPAVKPAAEPRLESGERFTLALPRIEIEFDADGYPHVLGMRLVDLAALFNVDVAGLRLAPSFVAGLTAANIQHVEMRQYGDGLALMANGALLPHVAWSDASLKQAVDVATLFGVQNPDLIKRLAPLVRRLGLDVVLKFPLSSGAQAMPLSDASMPVAAPQPEGVDPSVIIWFEVKYDDNGVPAILGMSAYDLFALGLDSRLPLALSPDAIAMLQARNIQNMELRTKPDGLYIYVNGSPLPNLVWDNNMLSSAAGLYAPMLPDDATREMIHQVVTVVDNLDIAVLLHFPPAPGAAPIPAKIH